MRRAQLAAGLDSAKTGQQIRGLDLRYGHLTDPRKDADFEPADDLARIAGSPGRRELLKPFPGDGFKRIAASKPFDPSLRAEIDALPQVPSGLVPKLARLREFHLGKDA